MKLQNSILLVLLISSLPKPASALEQRYHHVGFYIENFGGRVDPDTLPHVYEVFKKIREVAEVNDRNLPQLVVIKDLPGPPAFVLPDGNLVLAQQALDVIYDDVPLWKGNTRLAFILGHELAHLASDDFWSGEVKHLIQSKALSGEVDKAILELIEQDKKSLMESELKADDKGFLYAATARFPVDELLFDEDDFLSFWVAKTHTQSSTTHPDSIQRTELLRDRLKQKKKSLEFFYMGVRLAHLGRYQDAVHFFREFQKVFPGCDVFNNLGVCYLQMAIRKMPPAIAYQYWLPGILDNKTLMNRLDVLPIFRDRTQFEIAKDYLEQAKIYLKKATEKCPAYRIGYINLAVTYFYLDEVYQARAAIEEARRLQPDDPEVESLRALILSGEAEPMDGWATAEGIFSDLTESDAKDSFPMSVYYNWARLLEARGRSAESQWQKLTKHKDELPWPIAQMLCERLEDSSAIEQCLEEINEAVVNKETTFRGSLVVQPGFGAWKIEKEKHPLKNWKKLLFNWQGEAASSGIIHTGFKGDVVLEMDGVVEMVVLKQNPEQSEKLLQEYGSPHYKKAVLNGELWFYSNWVVLLNQGEIQEFWVVRKNL